MNHNRWIFSIGTMGLLVFLTFAQTLRAANAAATPAAPAQGVEEQGLPTGKYIAGGIVGTAVGLGIGHAIQDRYMPLGLLFSVGEGLGYVAVFGAFAPGGTLNDSLLLFTLGYAAIIGLRVWETVDLWVTGTRLHKKYVSSHRGVSLSVLPAVVVRGESAPGLTLALTF